MRTRKTKLNRRGERSEAIYYAPSHPEINSQLSEVLEDKGRVEFGGFVFI